MTERAEAITVGGKPTRTRAAPIDVPTALYRLYDAEGRLLYVGISNSPYRRWAQHSVEQSWWPQVVTHKLEWHEDRNAAMAAEREAVQSERPTWNEVHKVAAGAPEAAGRLEEWAELRRSNDQTRDPLVKGAHAAGITKHRIHVLTGIARTTIDDILKEER